MLRKGEPEGLSGVAVGAVARVAAIELAVEERVRLAGFGIRPGATLAVLGRTPGGGQLLGVGTSRIALDRCTARRIAVTSGREHGE